MLLNQTRGYFNRDTPVVGHLERPINYWKVYCKEEWNIVVNKKYNELQVMICGEGSLVLTQR